MQVDPNAAEDHLDYPQTKTLTPVYLTSKLQALFKKYFPKLEAWYARHGQIRE